MRKKNRIKFCYLERLVLFRNGLVKSGVCISFGIVRMWKVSGVYCFENRE